MNDLLRSLMSKVRNMSKFGVLPTREIDLELIQLVNNLTNKGLTREEAIQKLADCEITNRNTESTRRYLEIITK